MNVSIISDFLNLMMPENMDEASLGLSGTDEDDLLGDLEEFEQTRFDVRSSVSENMKIKMNVELTLPSEHKKITSTFVIEGTQKVENEEYNDMIKELSKNEKSRTTMADEVSNLKNLENPLIYFAVNEQSEKFTQYGSETTLLDETSMHFNVKEYNAVTTEINDKNFYIIIAQFKQQPKEMVWNIVETITERTDQSNRKIVIRTSLPENTTQCFDVACENAMAKMDYTIGRYFQYLYLRFLSKEFVLQFEETQQQHLVVFIDENENENSLKR